MLFDIPLLSLVIWLPIFGGIAVLLNGDNGFTRPLSLIVSVATLYLSFGLYTGFDMSTHDMQFIETIPWIATYGIHYSLGIDGFSMPLIILTAFSTVVVVVAGWEVIQDRVSQYMAAFLIMSGLMTAVFASLDAIVRTRITQELIEWVEQEQITVLLITHDLEEAISLSDAVHVLSPGPKAYIKASHQVNIPRPRDILDTRNSSNFAPLLKTLWNELVGERKKENIIKFGNEKKIKA